MDWRGPVWLGKERHGSLGQSRIGKAGIGQARQSWIVIAGFAKASHGADRQSRIVSSRIGQARLEPERLSRPNHKGKTMPVNPEEVCFIPGGGPNTYVLPGGRVVRGSEARNSDENTVMGYVSHFATCPERDNMRKK